MSSAELIAALEKYSGTTPPAIDKILESGLAQKLLLNLADNASLPWKLRLGEKTQAERDLIDAKASELAERHGLRVRVCGSEKEVNRHFEALHQIGINELEAVLKRMLVSTTTTTIAENTLFGLSELDRANADAGDNWLVAASTMEKVVNREIGRVMSEIDLGGEDEKGRALRTLFEPEYNPSGSEDDPAQILVGLV